MIARILFLAIVSYLLLLVVVYVAQRSLQYFPDKSYPGKPQANGVTEMQEVEAVTIDGLKLLAWFAPPKEKNGKIIIIYHGNAGNLALRAFKAKEFIKAGYGVYLCEYRGYGGNAGSPSEEGFYADARSALKWLEKKGYSPGQWVIYGESIGSGPAVQMALEFQPKQLIIEAGFSSAVDIAGSVYPWLPVGLLLKDRYDNISKIKNIKSSLLMVHGSDDYLTRIAFAKKLYEEANHPKDFIIVEGGQHNDLYDFKAGKMIINWLKPQK